MARLCHAPKSTTMASTVEQTNRRRQRFIDAGLCHLCGQEPPLKGHKAGRECLMKRNAQKIQAREEAFFGGNCEECRNNPVKEGLRRCEECLQKARERATDKRRSSTCETCGETTGCRRAKWCDKHRPAPGKTRRYKADARTAEMIREAYALGAAARKPGEKGKAYVTCLAKKLGWPYWALQKEAQRLGVTRIKADDWSEEELEILQRNAHWTPSTIRQRLKSAGYLRSITAISMKRTRLNLFKSHDYMSPFDLAKNCFGVAQDVVARWIKRGWLRAMERKDTERGDNCYWIKQQWVYDFVVKHPLAFDLRKVDQLWFIDLLTNGNVGVPLQESKDGKQLSISEMERNEFGGE